MEVVYCMSIDVLYCFDENYAKVAAVSILSLLEHHKDLVIHVFTVGISDDTREKFEKWLRQYSVPIYFYNINDKVRKYKEIFIRRKVNVGTFGRLVAPSILPNTIEKLLYLDCDTIVLSELDEMINLPLTEDYLAGVYDMALPPVNVKGNLGFDENDVYINAGILYINMKLWRENNLEQMFYDFCREHPDAIFYDQDAINYVCHDRIYLLPARYNMTFITSELPLREAKRVLDTHTFELYSSEEYTNSQENVCIVHFASEIFGKPWFDVSNIRFADKWREYYAKTPWASRGFMKRKYSNNTIIGIYKKYCEKIITYFYLKKKYGAVVTLYNILYKFTHKIQRITKG